MSDPARTRLRHRRDGMIVDLWMPATAITYAQALAALGKLGFEMRREDNDADVVMAPYQHRAERPPPRDTGQGSP